jgi:hypothetical protein
LSTLTDKEMINALKIDKLQLQGAKPLVQLLIILENGRRQIQPVKPKVQPKCI